MSAFCVPIFRVSLYIWILETVSPIVHPERHNRFGKSKKHFPFIRAFRWKDRFLLYVIKRHFTWYQHKGSVLSWQLLPTSVFKLNFCLHNKPRFFLSFSSLYLISRVACIVYRRLNIILYQCGLWRWLIWGL